VRARPRARTPTPAHAPCAAAYRKRIVRESRSFSIDLDRAKTGVDLFERLWLTRERWLTLLLLTEGLLLGLRFDTESLARLGQHWWTGVLAEASIVMSVAVAVGTAAVLFASERLRDELRRVRAGIAGTHRSWPFLLGHLVSFAVFLELTALILEGDLGASPNPGPWVLLWLLVGITVVSLWTAALIPYRALLPLAGALPLLSVGLKVSVWVVTAKVETSMRSGSTSSTRMMGGLQVVLRLDRDIEHLEVDGVQGSAITQPGWPGQARARASSSSTSASLSVRSHRPPTAARRCPVASPVADARGQPCGNGARRHFGSPICLCRASSRSMISVIRGSRRAVLHFTRDAICLWRRAVQENVRV